LSGDGGRLYGRWYRHYQNLFSGCRATIHAHFNALRAPRRDVPYGHALNTGQGLPFLTPWVNLSLFGVLRCSTL